MKKIAKREFNKTVVIQSILALISFALSFILHWLFIVPVAYLIWSNQKELYQKNNYR